MRKHDKLDCFLLVKAGEAISPILTTTREYGAWFSSYFDSYTSGQELCCKAKTINGQQVLENHPGTKIGKFFDTKTFKNPDLNCWFLKSDSDLIKQLVFYGLADMADCTTRDKERVLRVYTVKQIELYIQMTIDKGFHIGSLLLPSRKVQVNVAGSYIKPVQKIQKRSLF